MRKQVVLVTALIACGELDDAEASLQRPMNLIPDTRQPPREARGPAIDEAAMNSDLIPFEIETRAGCTTSREANLPVAIGATP